MKSFSGFSVWVGQSSRQYILKVGLVLCREVQKLVYFQFGSAMDVDFVVVKGLAEISIILSQFLLVLYQLSYLLLLLYIVGIPFHLLCFN